jgi:hypothetical protein
MFEAWLTAWLIGITAVAALIAVSWSVGTYRELERAGAPRSGRIVTRLWFSPVARLLRLGDRGQTHPGRRVWVWWHLRWGPSGQTEATIRGADGTALHLSLAKPMGFSLATGELLQTTDVRFLPFNRHSYTWGTPTGVVEPMDSVAWHEAPGECPRARLCVLETVRATA